MWMMFASVLIGGQLIVAHGGQYPSKAVCESALDGATNDLKSAIAAQHVEAKVEKVWCSDDVNSKAPNK